MSDVSLNCRCYGAAFLWRFGDRHNITVIFHTSLPMCVRSAPIPHTGPELSLGPVPPVMC